MTKEQLFRNVQTYLGLKPDGIAGSKTLASVVNSLGLPKYAGWEAVQGKLGLKVDGVAGVMTAKAVYDALLPDKLKTDLPAYNTAIPTEAQVPSFYGRAGDNLITIDLPYPMRLAWDAKTTVTKMSVNAKVADRVKRIFKRTLQHYGLDGVQRLGLDLFGGCFNNRSKVGGTTKSMHAYGIAIDLDPDNNQLKWGYDRATFAGKEYIPFWDIVEAEGAISLGRAKNYDWMHFQFSK